MEIAWSVRERSAEEYPQISQLWVRLWIQGLWLGFRCLVEVVHDGMEHRDYRRDSDEDHFEIFGIPSVVKMSPICDEGGLGL